ncbi:MAG: hypothetical protein GY699_09455 [Desulfobacteraceae bacterium]|nr:hypothetical protein [Desulfobacteraceae bacterium]
MHKKRKKSSRWYMANKKDWSKSHVVMGRSEGHCLMKVVYPKLIRQLKYMEEHWK